MRVSINIILRERRNLNTYTPLISKVLSPAIGDVRKPLAMFIDNADEYMDKHVGSRLRDWGKPGGKSLGSLKEDVWVSAQLGLMEAAKAINGRNTHIKIFASIRLEAFSGDSSPTHLQTRDICTILKYSDDELKQIFTGNIRRMRSNDLVDPSAENPIDRFLGFSTVQHPFVTEQNGNPKSEGAFRYILRHTLRRPRELLKMGGEIAQIPVDRRVVKSCCRKVNEVSAELLRQYKSEIVPFWNDEECHTLISAIRTNVITQEQVAKLTEESPTWKEALATFYRRGLIGVLHSKDHGQELEQSFLPAAEHLLNQNETLPTSTHYLLHPCLEDELRCSIFLDQEPTESKHHEPSTPQAIHYRVQSAGR